MDSWHKPPSARSYRALGSLWNIFEGVYAALYDFSLRRWHGDEAMASWFTACALYGAVSLGAVLVGTIVAVSLGLPRPIVTAEWIGDALAVAMLGGIGLAHYLAFIRNRRYRSVLQRFHSRSEREQRWLAVAAWAGLLLCYGGGVVFGFTMHWLGSESVP